MKKIGLVARREFLTRVRQRGFIITTLALPLVMIFVGFVSSMGGPDESGLAEDLAQEGQETRQGYVDQAEIIREIPDEIPPGSFLEYADLESADQALRMGKIEAYFLIDEDYLRTGRVERVSPSIPSSPPDVNAIEWILLWNLAGRQGYSQPALLRDPLMGRDVEFVDLRCESGQPSDSPAPMFVAVLLMVPLFMNGGMLFQSLAKEKEGRVMEILLASLRPLDLLAGKLLGVSALMFLQYAVWGALAAAGFLFAGAQLAPMVAMISVSVGEIGLILAYVAAGFFLYAGLMAGIGALATDTEGSRAWLFMITLPMTIPIYLGAPLAQAPHSPIAVALSLFPLSSPITMLIRITASVVPGWQIGLSLAALIVSVFGILWLMARLFRAQILLSGEPLSPRRFIQTLRTPRQAH